MSSQLSESNWQSLLMRIRDGKCTPFLGAGASYPTLPLGSKIARDWAAQYDYPLDDEDDLVRVAQFLAVQNDAIFPKEQFIDQYLRDREPPDFAQQDEPHALLADLPLPIYMTTNYDPFMCQALRSRGKTPHRELLPWNKYIGEQTSVFDAASGFEPTPGDPVVFHLHGHDQVLNSLVLAEGDYLDFLVNVSRDPDLIPARIQRALADTSLLFIGYSLADWSFRVVFQGIVQSIDANLRRISVTVQLPPRDLAPSDQKKAQEYLDEYYKQMDVKVYWGTAREFAAELRRRWEAFCHE